MLYTKTYVKLKLIVLVDIIVIVFIKNNFKFIKQSFTISHTVVVSVILGIVVFAGIAFAAVQLSITQKKIKTVSRDDMDSLEAKAKKEGRAATRNQ